MNKEKELKIKWRKEINENQSMKRFFEGFHANSIPSFINDYIRKKHLVFKHAAIYQKLAEKNLNKWLDVAYEHLKSILHKKLFDMQCKWRAEQIKIEGVTLCYDFECWKREILNCPYIEPISNYEIEIYQSFLLQSDDYHGLNLYGCQNYNRLKTEYVGSDDENCEIPDWYEYHNMVTGNGSLFLLPDIRGEKENFYVNLVRGKNHIIEIIAQEPIDERPYLDWYEKKDFDFFIKTFEDRETNLNFKNFNESNLNSRSTRFDYEKILDELLIENENIPIEANLDFKDALIKAYVKFRNTKIIEHLPIALEQYLFNKKMGLLFENNEPIDYDLRTFYFERILDGRAANGESRDFNF